MIQSLVEVFRRSCLDTNWFASIDDARRKTELWRQEYNDNEAQTELGGLTPSAYALRQLAVDARRSATQTRQKTGPRVPPVGWKPLTES